jgi:hypothetical protein
MGKANKIKLLVEPGAESVSAPTGLAADVRRARRGGGALHKLPAGGERGGR